MVKNVTEFLVDAEMPRARCAKNVFTEHGAVPEMKEGPSEPACRAGFKQP